MCDQLCAQSYCVGSAAGVLSVSVQPRGSVNDCTCYTPIVVDSSPSLLRMLVSSSSAGGQISVSLAAPSGERVVRASVDGTTCSMAYAVQSGVVLGVSASASAPVVLTLATASAACSRGRDACDVSCSESYVYESYSLSATETVGTLLPARTSVGNNCRCYTPLITSFTSSGISGVLSKEGVGFTVSTSGRESVVTIPDLPGCSLT